MNDQFSVWIELDPNGVSGVQYVAGPVAVDAMATEEETQFKSRLLRRRADEFCARSIFAFVMEESQS